VEIRPRVLIVTAAMGSGHREVGLELARRLTDRGALCASFDLVDDTGPAGRRLQRTYRTLLARAPWVYDGAMRFWARHPGPLEAFTAANARPFERALAAAMARFRPDAVVATYNLAGKCLGRLRARGELTCPVTTLVIDPGPHPYWVSAHVDRHLAPLPATAERLAAYGARGVTVTAPVLRPEFTAAPGRAAARAAVGLPPEARVVLVNGGSWAAGHVARTVALLARRPDLTTVVLCGRDERLAGRLAGRPRVVPVRWTPRVVDHLAAADVVVDNAGGLTCWEALACRRPVVLFDPLPGHGRLNAATLHSAGLATWLHSPAELLRHVDRIPAPAPLPPRPDPAGLVLDTTAGVAA
jgi:UDP-N-acetylglucosamine:LPS N-acetylglucosamine transferase